MRDRGTSPGPGATLSFVLLVLASGLLRAGSPPVFHGEPDRPISRLEALAAPFGDDLRGDGNAFLSLLARSLLREGWSDTGGIPLLNVQDGPREQYLYYDHHTPGIPWLAAGAFSLFGDQESTTRCVALFFSTLTTLVVVLICARWSTAAGLAAWAACTFLPAGWYWASHLNYEVPTMPFTTAFLALTAASGGRGRTLAAMALLAVGFFLDLVALFAAGALILECLRRRPRRALAWLAYGSLLFLAWWWWKEVQEARWGRHQEIGLREHLLQVSLLSPELDLGDWLRTAPAHVATLVGSWPLLIWAAELFLALRRERDSFSSRWLRRSSWLAVLAVVVPAARSYDHEYYGVYFLVPVALAFARSVRRGEEFLRARGATRPSAFAIPALAILSLAFTGILAERGRSTPDPRRPGVHHLALELNEAQPDRDVQIALEPGAQFHIFTLAYYTDRPVFPLAPGDELGLGRREWLLPFGRAFHPLVLALDPQWPGRGGYRELPIPPEYQHLIPDADGPAPRDD